MSQKETIEKYIDAFLKGRSQSAVDKFKAKAEKLQYASIMQWRRRMRKLENTPKGTKEILDTLHRAQTLIENASITDSDMNAIQAELTVLDSTLSQCYEKARNQRINELEEQKRRISEQLELLKQS